MLRFRRGENVKPEDLQNTHIGGSTEDREQVDKGWGTGLAGCGVATIHYPSPPPLPLGGSILYMLLIWSVRSEDVTIR